MSTPESPSSKPDIFTQFAARLREAGADAQNGPSDEVLASFDRSLRGAAFRTGASGVLYGEVDATAITTGASEAPALRVVGNDVAPNPAISSADALAAILKDV